MQNFTGTIIEESLKDKSVLDKVKILSTRISEVTEKHHTPWLKKWTLHKVEIKPVIADAIAGEISNTLETAHSSWYADFKNQFTHYVIYPNKIFIINRTRKEEYDEASKYGLDLGIPPHQIDFAKDVVVWKK